MSDLELLQMAAKGAGFQISDWDKDDVGRPFGILRGEKWMPQMDGSDAFVLQIRMSCRVYCYQGGGDDYTICATDQNREITGWAREDHNGDPHGATCRAIVSAVADIGRKMA